MDNDPNNETAPPGAITDIRSRVATAALERVGVDLPCESTFVAELAELLAEAKPPKADRLVELYDSHAEANT